MAEAFSELKSCPTIAKVPGAGVSSTIITNYDQFIIIIYQKVEFSVLKAAHMWLMYVCKSFLEIFQNYQE